MKEIYTSLRGALRGHESSVGGVAGNLEQVHSAAWSDPPAEEAVEAEEAALVAFGGAHRSHSLKVASCWLQEVGQRLVGAFFPQCVRMWDTMQGSSATRLVCERHGWGKAGASTAVGLLLGCARAPDVNCRNMKRLGHMEAKKDGPLQPILPGHGLAEASGRSPCRPAAPGRMTRVAVWQGGGGKDGDASWFGIGPEAGPEAGPAGVGFDTAAAGPSAAAAGAAAACRITAKGPPPARGHGP